MSRASTSSQRNLTLTEELEKLEQTITLTLQGQCPRDPELTRSKRLMHTQKSTTISAAHTES